MNDDEKQVEFDRLVKQIVEKILRQETESIEAARGLLEQTRLDVIAKLAEGGRTEWDYSWLRQVQAALGTRIERLNRELELRMNQDINKVFDLANQLVDEPAKVLIGTSPVLGVSREVAQVAASFSATMIKDLTSSAQVAIDGVIQRAAVGGLTVQDAIKQIGSSLDDSKFGPIAARAERIFRTEVLRVQSIATQARMQVNKDAMRRAGWALGKRWLATIDKRARLSHVIAMGQEREVEQPFIVGGEELMYPRDPNGSASLTINCRCVSSPTVQKIFKLDRTTKFER
ncbi:MAG: phage minor head protein [Blastocatellia bacterium]